MIVQIRFQELTSCRKEKLILVRFDRSKLSFDRSKIVVWNFFFFFPVEFYFNPNTTKMFGVLSETLLGIKG